MHDGLLPCRAQDADRGFAQPGKKNNKKATANRGASTMHAYSPHKARTLSANAR
jgi:hypothetical protein